MKKKTEERLAYASAVLAVALVGILLWVLPARAEYSALVLICKAEGVEACNRENARIYFLVPVESSLPTGCLVIAQQKTAQVADMVGSDEATKIICPLR